MQHYPRLAFDDVKTFSVRGRTNLVTLANMGRPGEESEPLWQAPGFSDLMDAIVEARRRDRPVIWSMGAHVVKNGLSRYVIELVDQGWVTHVAGNGATTIHDFELAYLGGTSEDVATAIEDGSFGMWEETGRWMNAAIQTAADRGQGYGEGIAAYMQARPARFLHLQDCIIARTVAAGRPYTCHLTLGADIIHQHPSVDFGALAYCSGRDFERFCRTVTALEGGVVLNFGSAVSGPLIFLRALSLAHHLGHSVRPLAAANFDLRPESVAPSRARSDLLEPVIGLGGQGWHFTVPHEASIPSLYRHLVERGEGDR